MAHVNPAPVDGATPPTKPYKALVAAAIAVAITVLQVVMSQQGDGQWTTEDTLVTVLAFLGAVGVYFQTNPPA